MKLKRSGRVLTIALSDVDDFKRVNDAFGHEFGDRVLKRVAEILRSQVREQDIVARWGGEEFIFLFPETDLSGATVVAEKIRAKIERDELTAPGQPLQVTLTLGLAEVSRDDSLEASMARADRALYEGKRLGKNRVVSGCT